MTKKTVTAGLAILGILAVLVAGCASSKGDVKDFKVKDEVAVGKSVWKVLTVEKTAATENGAKATGTYVFVQLTVKNNSNEAATLTGVEVELFDADGNTYPYDTKLNSTFLTSQGKDALVNGRMEPGETISGWIAFDIPKDVKGVKMRVRDLDITSDKSALIDLDI